MKSSNITVTDGRLMRALNNATQAIANNTSLSGNNTQKDNELHVGKLTRFFYETQEAEVKLTEKTGGSEGGRQSSPNASFLTTRNKYQIQFSVPFNN